MKIKGENLALILIVIVSLVIIISAIYNQVMKKEIVDNDYCRVLETELNMLRKELAVAKRDTKKAKEENADLHDMIKRGFGGEEKLNDYIRAKSLLAINYKLNGNLTDSVRPLLDD